MAQNIYSKKMIEKSNRKPPIRVQWIYFIIFFIYFLNQTKFITMAPVETNNKDITIISQSNSNPLICSEYIAEGMNNEAESDENDNENYDDDDDNNNNSNNNDEIITNKKENKLTKIPGQIQCTKPNQFCYSVWRIDLLGNITLARQGCWQQNDDKENCSKLKCISKVPRSSANNHRFCCCAGHLCNENKSIETDIIEYQNQLLEQQVEMTKNKYSTQFGFETTTKTTRQYETTILFSPIMWTLLAVTTGMIMGLTIFFIFSSQKKFTINGEQAPLAPSSFCGRRGGGGCGSGATDDHCDGTLYSSDGPTIDNLKLCAIIGQGKYGTVWKGLMNNEKEVAVKIFPSQNKQYFLNEKQIYSLNFMDVPYFLEYYGCDTRTTLTDKTEYLLIFSLAEFGCLQDWLLHNKCSFTEFIKMSKSITRALSHLHTEIKKNDQEKPCICHRDLNSRNILVKSDLTCCIADFGFALKTYGARYEWKGEIKLAETKSIQEVGTLRYMAPEVLEGAVNLRECETALKQIDVYSLGLVLWELAVRCQDWYPNGEQCSEYRAPYDEEVGKNASFEHMQIMVSRHKIRPQFPINWGGKSASARLLRETCEDCWDHDAEARLTALCAEERINELAVLGPNAQSTKTTPTSSDGGEGGEGREEGGASTSSSSSLSSSSLNESTNVNRAAMISQQQQQQQLQIAALHAMIKPPPPLQIVSNNNKIMSPSEMNNEIITPPPNQIVQTNINPTIIPNIQNHQQFLTNINNEIDYLGNGSGGRNNNCNVNGIDYVDGTDSIEDLITSTSLANSCENILNQSPTKKLLINTKSWLDVRTLIRKSLFKRSKDGTTSSSSSSKSKSIDGAADGYNNSGGGGYINKLIVPIDVDSLIMPPSVPGIIIPTTVAAAPPPPPVITPIEHLIKLKTNPDKLNKQKSPIKKGLTSTTQQQRRPKNLDLLPSSISEHHQRSHRVLSLPNTVSAQMTNCGNECVDDSNNMFKKPPGDLTNQLPFAVVSGLGGGGSGGGGAISNNCDLSKTNNAPRIVISKSATTVKQFTNSLETIDDAKLKRQRSLDMFHEVFGAKGSIERLRDPSQRVKTPGDVPPSVRKIRASKTLSLYDDRMMDTTTRNTM